MSDPALGLASGVVTVMPYDPRWADEFATASKEIQDAVGSQIIAINHVGSTAVPGLCAKPILDILVAVPDFEKSLALVPALEAIGYEFRPKEDIPDRHYFRRRRATVGTHHLSLAEPSSHHYVATMAFRDALRADPGKADEYCRLKNELARRFPFDREKYIDGKTQFVLDVLTRSLS